MTESVSMPVKTADKGVKAAKAAKPRSVKPRAEAGAKVAKGTKDKGTKERKSTETIRVSPEERYRMISERAYLLAEQRSFQGGDAVNDWLEAEAEVDSKFKTKKGRRASN